jgi:hypothetical protein
MIRPQSYSFPRQPRHWPAGDVVPIDVSIRRSSWRWRRVTKERPRCNRRTMSGPRRCRLPKTLWRNPVSLWFVDKVTVCERELMTVAFVGSSSKIDIGGGGAKERKRIRDSMIKREEGRERRFVSEKVSSPALLKLYTWEKRCFRLTCEWAEPL